MENRPSDCPLNEVPEPHGRLIDAEKLKSYWAPDHSRYFDADYFIHTMQWYFNHLYDGLKAYYDTNVVYREWNGRIETITNYLMSNDIMTEENLKKLEDIKTFLRIGAIDGCAGKMDISECQYVDGDCLFWIWYKGKQVTKKYHKHGIKVKGYTTYDEFGDYDRFSINLDRLTGI